MREFRLLQIVAHEKIYMSPVSDGCVNDFYHFPWTLGENVDSVDDNINSPDDDNSYIYTTSESVVSDLYHLEEIDISGDINYVRVFSKAKSNESPQDEGGVYKLILTDDDGSNIYSSEDIDLTTDYQNYSKVWTVNPNTLSDWTVSEINNLQIGVEANSPIKEEDKLNIILRPDGNGNTNGWNNIYGASTHWECVDENSADGYTSYIYDNQQDIDSGKTEMFTVTNASAVTDTDTINYVTVYAKVAVTNISPLYPPVYRFRVKVRSGGNTYQSDMTSISGNDGWVLLSKTWYENPDTGSAWTLSEINSMEIGTWAQIEEYKNGSYSEFTQIYAVVNYTPLVSSPEIRTTQIYAEVDYNFNADCRLSIPSEISVDHNRNVCMLNFWNGEREVYDLARNNKSMVFKGVEFYGTDAEKTATFYFDGYDAAESSGWDDSSGTLAKMVDGDTGTYGVAASSSICAMDSNTYNYEESGTISKVELRMYGYEEAGASNNKTDLRPVFTNGDGDNHSEEWSSTSPYWTTYFDITEDTNAPTIWTWNDVKELGCDVQSMAHGSSNRVSKVEIRVTYVEAAACTKIQCVRDMGRRKELVTISGLSHDCFNGDFYISSFGWKQISKKPEVYEWILQLEDAEL